LDGFIKPRFNRANLYWFDVKKMKIKAGYRHPLTKN